MALPDALFWSPAQASFLREQRQLDADWAQPIDELSVALRNTPVLPTGQSNSSTTNMR